MHRAIAALAAVAASVHGQTAAPNASYTYRILNNPTTGDAFGLRVALQQNAEQRSDRMFSVLDGILGGQRPSLNFLPTGAGGVENDLSANVEAAPGMPANTVNVSPLATEALINDKSPWHNSSVNQLPHEFSHLRQLPSVLASLALREGSAQAFADLVTPVAAKRAGIPYTPGNYDGTYGEFVKQAQARGNDWLLGTQFGHPPVSWP